MLNNEVYPVTQETFSDYYPVTQESLATLCKDGLADEEEKNWLYDAVLRLVCMLANRRKNTLNEDMEDLIQQAFERIWDKIDTYDYKRGKFTTWAFWVTKSVYDYNHREMKKYREHFVRVDCDSKEERTTFAETQGTDDNLRKEIKFVINDLYEKHPEIHDVLHAFFGNPNNENFLMPTDFSIQDTVDKVGRKYSEVYDITRNIIRPAFSKISLN